MNAASWVSQIAGYESINESSIMKTVLSGLKRQLAKPHCRKEPITPEILLQMASSVNNPPSLSDSRLLSICLLAFSGFMRFNEIVKLHYCDVCFNGDHMSVTVKSSIRRTNIAMGQIL